MILIPAEREGEREILFFVTQGIYSRRTSSSSSLFNKCFNIIHQRGEKREEAKFILIEDKQMMFRQMKCNRAMKKRSCASGSKFLSVSVTETPFSFESISGLFFFVVLTIPFFSVKDRNGFLFSFFGLCHLKFKRLFGCASLPPSFPHMFLYFSLLSSFYGFQTHLLHDVC